MDSRSYKNEKDIFALDTDWKVLRKCGNLLVFVTRAQWALNAICLFFESNSLPITA